MRQTAAHIVLAILIPVAAVLGAPFEARSTELPSMGGRRWRPAEQAQVAKGAGRAAEGDYLSERSPRSGYRGFEGGGHPRGGSGSSSSGTRDPHTKG